LTPLCLFELSLELAETFFFVSTSISSDAAPFEEDFEDDQQVGEGEEEVGDDEDEMADFIVEEDEIDGNGQVVRCGSLSSYLLNTCSMVLALWNYI
jgi:hypothetical protein